MSLGQLKLSAGRIAGIHAASKSAPKDVETALSALDLQEDHSTLDDLIKGLKPLNIPKQDLDPFLTELSQGHSKDFFKPDVIQYMRSQLQITEVAEVHHVDDVASSADVPSPHVQGFINTLNGVFRSGLLNAAYAVSQGITISPSFDRGVEPNLNLHFYSSPADKPIESVVTESVKIALENPADQIESRNSSNAVVEPDELKRGQIESLGLGQAGVDQHGWKLTANGAQVLSDRAQFSALFVTEVDPKKPLRMINNEGQPTDVPIIPSGEVHHTKLNLPPEGIHGVVLPKALEPYASHLESGPIKVMFAEPIEDTVTFNFKLSGSMSAEHGTVDAKIVRPDFGAVLATEFADKSLYTHILRFLPSD